MDDWGSCNLARKYSNLIGLTFWLCVSTSENEDVPQVGAGASAIVVPKTGKWDDEDQADDIKVCSTYGTSRSDLKRD